MDNMASVATNEKAVLEQIVTTTTTQYAAIKALLQEVKNSTVPIILAATSAVITPKTATTCAN